MKKRFLFELSVGVVLAIAIFVFGTAGLAALALLAFQPFIGKKKADEREYQLFYKAGNVTAAFTLLACVIIYYFSDVAVNGQLIGKNWLGLVVAAFLLVHGLSGLVIFREN
jgi:hypothetical protein